MIGPSLGISDTPATVLKTTTACVVCGGTALVGRGTCASCLLRSAVSEPGEPSRDQFDRVLREVDVPDQHWRLGNYHILGQIGRGGMGVIYRARQRHSRRS